MKQDYKAQKELKKLREENYKTSTPVSGYFFEDTKWVAYAGDREVFVEEFDTKERAIKWLNKE